MTASHSADGTDRLRRGLRFRDIDVVLRSADTLIEIAATGEDLVLLKAARAGAIAV